MTKIGIWADRDTLFPSPQAGDFFIVTDGPLNCVYDGSAWRSMWRGKAVTPALLTDGWTDASVSGGSVTDSKGAMLLAGAAGTAQVPRAYVAVTGLLKFRAFFEASYVPENFAALITLKAYRTASSKDVSFSVGSNVGTDLRFAFFTANALAFDANLQSDVLVQRECPTGLELDWSDGTNIVARATWSLPGADRWVQIGTTTQAAYIGGTPDRVYIDAAPNSQKAVKTSIVHVER